LRTHDNGKRGDEKNKNGKGKNNKEFHDGEKVAFYQLTRKYFFLFFIYFFLCHGAFFCWQKSNRKRFFYLLDSNSLRKPLSVNELQQNDPYGVAST
jgi:hypothetical protein